MFQVTRFVTLFFVLVTASSTTVADTEGSIIGDIARLLPGTYTNEAQLASIDGVTDAFALTTIIKPLSNPTLGETLYYLEEFKDNDPSSITRIRIYSFWPEDGGVRLLLLNPTDVDSLQGAHTDLARAERLTMSDIKVDRDGCMLDVTRHNDTLVSRMRHQACDVLETWVDYELIIDQTGTWTCYARRQQADDSLVWLQMPAFPCIRQQRIAGVSP
ncbi:MAG: CpcT/CpeT family chromophore lyase [Rhodospirillaceae bacterium]